MMISKAFFKARLIAYPEITDEKTKEKTKIGSFTVGKFYKVYAVADFNTGYTDFLIADHDGIYHWLNMSIFRSK